MIDFSAKRKGRAKDEKLEPRQLAVAELMAWGWDPTDAMLAVGLVQESDTKLDAQHAAVNFTANEDFDAIYKKRVKQLRNGAVLDEYQKLHPTPGSTGSNRGRPRADGTSSERKLWEGPLDEPATDEEILSAMWSTITKLKPEDPKRVDLLDKYDKLKRRQGANEEDTTIHFYLPRPECDTCPFRGNHVITEPEKPTAPESEPPAEDPTDAPKPGYSKYGKKIGRPPKRRTKKRQKAETPKE